MACPTHLRQHKSKTTRTTPNQPQSVPAAQSLTAATNMPRPVQGDNQWQQHTPPVRGAATALLQCCVSVSPKQCVVKLCMPECSAPQPPSSQWRQKARQQTRQGNPTSQPSAHVSSVLVSTQHSTTSQCFNAVRLQRWGHNQSRQHICMTHPFSQRRHTCMTHTFSQRRHTFCDTHLQSDASHSL